MPLTFVITGTLPHPRSDYIEIIEEAGHRVSSSVTSTTHYLVAGIDGGSKLDRARQLNVPIIGERDLWTILCRHSLGTPDHQLLDPDSRPIVDVTPKRTIYHFATDSFGEVEGMFDTDLNLLGAWSRNDAGWRDEYFSPFMQALGVKVETLPRQHTRAAQSAICAYFDWDDPESDPDF